MKTLEYKKFELKSVDFNQETQEMFIEGYASVFGNEDAKQFMLHPELKQMVVCSDIMEQNSFSKTINENKERIAFCLNHNLSDPKGKIIELKEDNNGLFARIRISDAEPELKTKIKEEIYQEFSFGFNTLRAAFEKKSDGTYIRRVKEVKLWEISLVTIGRNDMAKITDVKSYENAIQTIDTLIESEKNQEKKYKLMQLKELIAPEPSNDDTQAAVEEKQLQTDIVNVFKNILKK